MKALSVKQPWASLIAMGQKTLEIRSWRTTRRGPIAIVSSVGRSRIQPLVRIPRHAPTGVLLALVELVDCVPFKPSMVREACVDWIPDHWAWRIHVIKQSVPVPLKGRLGFWDLPEEVKL